MEAEHLPPYPRALKNANVTSTLLRHLNDLQSRAAIVAGSFGYSVHRKYRERIQAGTNGGGR